MPATKEGKLRLNKRQAAFAQLVASGESQITAYQQVYDCEYSTAHANGHKLAARPHVKHAISTLTKGGTVLKTLTRDRKRELLASIAEGDDLTSNRLQAIKVDNEMTGDNAPVRHDVTVLNLNELMQSDTTRGVSAWDDAIEAEEC